MSRRVAITGAGGYVGGVLARGFEQHGWEVVEMGRRSGQAGRRWVRFELGREVEMDWAGVEAVVHCAWEMKAATWERNEEVNVRGSARLLDAARAGGVRRGVFISSLSSFAGCRSIYGRAKLLVEAEALRLGYAVVRPGLVWGAEPGGIMGTMTRVVQRSPVVPLIGDGSFPQYPVHEEDLAEVVVALCQAQEPVPGEPVSAAAEQGVAFRELLGRVAARHGKRPVFLPVPWRLILLGLRVLEAAGVKPPVRSDSLIGFVFQNPKPDFKAMRTLGIKPREFA